MAEEDSEITGREPMLVGTVRQHFRATLLRLDAPQAVQDWIACPFFDPRGVQKKRSFLFCPRWTTPP